MNCQISAKTMCLAIKGENDWCDGPQVAMLR